MKKSFWIGIVVLLALAVVAGVYLKNQKTIPEEALRTDYDMCLNNCKSQQPESFCLPYCTCVKDSIPSQFSRQEYYKFGEQANSGQTVDPVLTEKINSIARECLSKVKATVDTSAAPAASTDAATPATPAADAAAPAVAPVEAPAAAETAPAEPAAPSEPQPTPTEE